MLSISASIFNEIDVLLVDVSKSMFDSYQVKSEFSRAQPLLMTFLRPCFFNASTLFVEVQVQKICVVNIIYA